MTNRESCTCKVTQSFGPDPIDDAEQDPFCPTHHFPLEELRSMFDALIARTEKQ